MLCLVLGNFEGICKKNEIKRKNRRKKNEGK